MKSELVFDYKKWHNYPTESLPKLLRGIASNHIGDYYCLGCFNSFHTKNALKRHEKLCDKQYYCHVEMPTEDKKNIKIQLRRKIFKSSIYNFR